MAGSPAAADSKMTAVDICDALERRYNKRSQGRDGEQYICLREARAGAGFDGNRGRCDFLAINTWPSRGMELIGHEVKVSMSDWKAELAKADKAERFARFCRRWYVAVPAELAAKIKHEVPPTWGLLSVSDKGACREVVPGMSCDPEVIPAWWWVGWIAQIDRQHKRAITRVVELRMAEERGQLREQVERDIEYRRKSAEEGIAKLRQNAAALKEATGVDLQHMWQHDITRLAKAWAMARTQFDTDNLARILRQAAESLDALGADDTTVEAAG